MKLLVQGDDYGFTTGVTYGMLDAIDNGVLRNTGLFTNMPTAPWAAQMFNAKERPACLGLDFNMVSGPSVSDPRFIPHLVDDKGEFIRSGVRIKDPRYQTQEGRAEMLPFEEVYRELHAQYDRFLELVGRKPGYLHTHSLGKSKFETYLGALSQLSRETGIPFSQEIRAKYGFVTLADKVAQGPLKKEFDPMAQLSRDPLKEFLAYGDEFLKEDYVGVTGHPAFVDNALLGLTTLSLERMKDHAMDVSPAFRQWIEENNVELITYYDLV